MIYTILTDIICQGKNNLCFTFAMAGHVKGHCLYFSQRYHRSSGLQNQKSPESCCYFLLIGDFKHTDSKIQKGLFNSVNQLAKCYRFLFKAISYGWIYPYIGWIFLSLFPILQRNHSNKRICGYLIYRIRGNNNIRSIGL